MKRAIPFFLLIVTLAFSCTAPQQKNGQSQELLALQAELDSLKNPGHADVNSPKGQITTFLTFQENNAEEAMNFYISLFKNSKVTDIQRYGKEGPAPEGSIMMARFELNGSLFACSDSYIKHEWNFTPGVSNWVDCSSEDEIGTLFQQLSEKGKVLMPVDNYGFSPKFAFVEDQFGVSWQLNWAGE